MQVETAGEVDDASALPSAEDAARVPVGVVGLGAMGIGMATSLRRGGFDVTVHDVRPEPGLAFAAEGGTAGASPAEVAAGVDVLISVVVNAAQTESVLFGEDGAADALRAGSVFVMCSTVDPGWSADLESRLAERGVLYLDAPISGGAVKSAQGELTMMTSGSPSAYAIAGPALEAMSARVYRLGTSAGFGSKVKIINQLLAGVHIAAAAEAMAFGIRAGLAPEDIYEVITHSAGNSWMFENRMAHVIAGDYTPLSAVDIFVKDLGLVLDSARPETFPLPLAAAAHQLFMLASSSGFGGEDDSAVIKIFPVSRCRRESSVDRRAAARLHRRRPHRSHRPGQQPRPPRPLPCTAASTPPTPAPGASSTPTRRTSSRSPCVGCGGRTTSSPRSRPTT